MAAGEQEQRILDMLQALEKSLRSALRRLALQLEAEDGNIKASALNISRMDSAIRNLRTEMSRMGLAEVRKRQLDALQAYAEDVLDKYGPGEVYSETSLRAIRMMIDGADADITRVAGDLADDVSRILRHAVLASGRQADLIAELADRVEQSISQMRALVTTSLAAFDRTLTVAHGKEAGVEWYAYLGPDDDVTRDWCSHWVGHRGRPEDFEATADRWGRDTQPKPVMAWGGGWNCRHDFLPLLGDDINKYPEGPA